MGGIGFCQPHVPSQSAVWVHPAMLGRNPTSCECAVCVHTVPCDMYVATLCGYNYVCVCVCVLCYYYIQITMYYDRCLIIESAGHQGST